MKQQSGEIGNESGVQSFPRAFPSSTDVRVLLLNQPMQKSGLHELWRHDILQCSRYSGNPGGVLREKIELGCAARLLKPLPYFRPDQKFDNLFHTWPLNQYPISDLPYNTIQYNTIQYNILYLTKVT